MKKPKSNTLFLIIALVTAGSLTVLPAFAQENIAISSSLVQPSPQEKLHALDLTRFHFITLKQFQGSLFNIAGDQSPLSVSEAGMLNSALDVFLNSAGRETILLDALRQNKAIQLKFSIQKRDEEGYQMVTYPDKPVLFRVEPTVKSIPVSIEIRPLLDQPIAFKISLRKGKDLYFYQVDWSGRLIRLA